MADLSVSQTPSSGRLRLLDLPKDVLQLIFDKIIITNDLTALALTHSALYGLAVPRIYSRFDIVWPENGTPSQASYSGVDALTYGLNTLVMSEEISHDPNAPFEQSHPQPYAACANPDSKKRQRAQRRNGRPPRPARRKNNLARFVRRFMIANGPLDCTQDYLISNEPGKMLSTLTALAVARMPRLENFTWDMPTGVSRDVWLALSSLGDVPDSKLRKVWIRCPDSLAVNESTNASKSNYRQSPSGDPSIMIHYRKSHPNSNFIEQSYERIESQTPNLSVLPPLKSITVLEIDEPAYLEELSQAISTSIDTLRELRVGMVSTSMVMTWSALDVDLAQKTKGHEGDAGYLAAGGVLGLVMSEVWDCRTQARPFEPFIKENDPGLIKSPSTDLPASETMAQAFASLVNGQTQLLSPDQPSQANLEHFANAFAKVVLSKPGDSTETASCKDDIEKTYQKLRLETLELEKIRIYTMVLRNAIEWSVLTSLTLLNCESDEKLWKALKLLYAPRAQYGTPAKTASTAQTAHLTTFASSSRPFISTSRGIEHEYCLSLKKLHTNKVSHALINFIRDALAPNTLEHLILQECLVPTSKVTIDDIYHGAIRVHRNSLRILMIDALSSRGPLPNTLTSGVVNISLGSNVNKGKKWAFSRKIINFIASGRMPALRELGFVMDYKDWHHLVQGLPQMPELRALYLPHIANNPYGAGYEARELAMQVLNIVALRLEMKLAYLGIWTSCYEILEDNGGGSDGKGSSVMTELAKSDSVNWYEFMGSEAGDEDNDDEDEEDEEVETYNADEGAEEGDDGEEEVESEEDTSNDYTATSASDDDDDDEDTTEDLDIDPSSSGMGQGRSYKQKKVRLKLREILFYDDGISVFKARLGRL
ncbi:hypothetical protein MMC25_003414 [Agyrium rufum]|nr:hypothetical protein [Agyrium rufum]